MAHIAESINTMFHDLFKDDNHPFIEDIKKVNVLAKKIITQQNNIKNNTIYKKIIKIPEGIQKNPIYKVLDKSEINKLEKEMNNVLNWKKLHLIVSKMSQFLLCSNIKNEKLFYNIISKKQQLNIMIIGSGPVGLFLASYLNLYYNYTNMNSKIQVNVVLYDNRINKPGFRKPYNRQRPFVTSSAYLNLLIPKLYCWSTGKSLWINIFMLEYLLYTIAINKYNVPIIYNDYKWDDYKKIIIEGKFKVVFDCSGGKLNLIENADAKWLTKKYNKEQLHKLNINPITNLVTLKNDKDFIKNHYYGSISIHKNDKYNTFIKNYDINIANNIDLFYLNKTKNKLFNIDEILLIISGIKNDITRNFLNYIIKNSNYKNYYFKIDVWSIYIRHALQISDVIDIDSHKILYIGAGDTIFHSHFVVGAGLNRTLDFTVKCANKLMELL